MAASGLFSSSKDRKVVVLGLPYDVDTSGLLEYMSQFGGVDDAIVMKERATGKSRGFGYVTYATAQDAKKASSAQHSLNGRRLEVKIATPKEEMIPSATRKISRIFVARIPLSVSEDMFRSHFEKYGPITDAYMPKDHNSKAHRGIGFVTFETSDSVDRLLGETHELGGSIIAVDRAAPKDDDTAKFWGGLYSYLTAAAQMGAFGDGSGGPALENEMAQTGLPANFLELITGATGQSAPLTSDQTTDNHAPTLAAGYGSGQGFDSGSNMPPPHGYGASTAPVASSGPTGAGSYSWSAPNANLGGYSAAYGSAPPSMYGASSAATPSYSEYGSGSGGGGGHSSGYGTTPLPPPPPPSHGSSGFSYNPGPPPSATSSHHASSDYGSSLVSAASAGYSYKPNPPPSSSGSGGGNKLFIGRLPIDATTEHLRTYFSKFGRILDVYIPKDPKKKEGHRGFGFVTFFDDGVAERVSEQAHEILGQSVAVDRPTPIGQQGGSAATPSHSTNTSTQSYMLPPNSGSYGNTAYGGPSGTPYYNPAWGSYGGNGGAYGSSTAPSDGSGYRPRSDFRYRPY